MLYKCADLVVHLLGYSGEKIYFNVIAISKITSHHNTFLFIYI